MNSFYVPSSHCSQNANIPNVHCSLVNKFFHIQIICNIKVIFISLWHSWCLHMVISGISDFVCLCLHSRRKMAWGINTKLCTVAQHALTWRTKGQRSRSNSYENRHGRMSVTSCCGCCAISADVWLYVAQLLRFLVVDDYDDDDSRWWCDSQR